MVRPPSVTPVLLVTDLQRSLDFYIRVLGYEDPAVHGDPPCFAMINRDGLDLMLSLAEGSSKPHPNGAHGVWDFHLRVSDLAADMARISAAGVAIDRGPTDTFYEMREIEVLDPDGYRICLGQDLR
jgi:catechol 2,3-dioxygenase-like lactoylglutathione lyase family enzyme